MKKKFIISVISMAALMGQLLHAKPVVWDADTANVQTYRQQAVVHVHDGDDHTQVVMSKVKVDVNHRGDTVSIITLGKRRIEIIEKGSDTKVRVTRINDKGFKGHCAGFFMGLNPLMTSGLSSDFSADDRFMELDLAKSINVGINFMQYSIPLTADNHLGLVTGAGFWFSNYRFDNPILLQRDPLSGIIVGKPVDDPGLLEKHKLVTTFIRFPLMLEWQMPSGDGSRKGPYVSAGGFMGLKTGSHTKVIYNDNTDKVYGNLNIQPWQYGLSFRVGYRWLNLYADYQLSSLFEKGKGPVAYPFSVGLMLVRF